MTEFDDLVTESAEASTGTRRIPVLSTASQLSWLVDAARAALVDNNHGPDVFRYGQTFVRIGRDDEGQPRLTLFTRPVFRDQLSRVARWTRPGRGDLTFDCSPPSDVTAAVFETADKVPDIPLLERVVTAPVLGRDGSVVTTPGYHAGSRVWYEPSPGFVLPPLPDVPSDADVAAALALVDDMLSEFPFATPSDRAHAIALFLLPFLRALITGPLPLQLVSSSTPGTGKGKLFTACMIPALGVVVSAEVLGESEAERRKKITANLMNGPTVVRIDNIKDALESAALEALLTTTVWSDRILGFSRQVELPNKTIWGATANNPEMKLDMARRTINIQLDAKTEKPWMRKIRRTNLEGWVLDNRARLVHAALVMCRAWVTRGSEPFTERALGSYESWSQVVGGVLQVAGVEGFLKNTGDFYDQIDQGSRSEREFVEEWWTRFGDQPVPTADLVEVARGYFDDLSLLQPAKSLGRRLKKLTKRVYLNDSVRVTQVPGRGSRYQLVRIERT